MKNIKGNGVKFDLKSEVNFFIECFGRIFFVFFEIRLEILKQLVVLLIKIKKICWGIKIYLEFNDKLIVYDQKRK